MLVLRKSNTVNGQGLFQVELRLSSPNLADYLLAGPNGILGTGFRGKGPRVSDCCSLADPESSLQQGQGRMGIGLWVIGQALD